MSSSSRRRSSLSHVDAFLRYELISVKVLQSLIGVLGHVLCTSCLHSDHKLAEDPDATPRPQPNLASASTRASTMERGAIDQRAATEGSETRRRHPGDREDPDEDLCPVCRLRAGTVTRLFLGSLADRPSPSDYTATTYING